MKRLLLFFSLICNVGWAQVYSPDPNFCFSPVSKIFDGNLVPDDDYLVPHQDGGYIFNARFNIINGQRVNDLIPDLNVKEYYKFDKTGKLVPDYHFLIPDKYVSKGIVLKSGKTLWHESNFSVTTARLIRLNEDGSIDKTFIYDGFESFIYKKYVLSSGKIIVSTDNVQHKIINEDGSKAKDLKMVFQKDAYPISNCTDGTNDYLLVGGPENMCKLMKINADFTLKEIYNKNLNNTSWLSYSKIYIDTKGRINLLLFNDSDSNYCIIIRLNQDGTPDRNFTTINVPRNKSLDPHTVKLNFTNDGKIIFNRVSQIVRFNENGTLDSTFNFSMFDENRVIYHVNEQGEVLLYDKQNGLRKVDVNAKTIPFELKLELDKPISFTDIISTNKHKFFAIGTNYVGRFDGSGKVEDELFSKDTVLVVKPYFDKKLLVQQAGNKYLFSENELKEANVPDIYWSGSLDYKNRKVYRVEGQNIARYTEQGTEELRFVHNASLVRQLYVLANGQLIAIVRLTNETALTVLRFNVDGSLDKTFQSIKLGSEGYFTPNYEVIELTNGNLCVKETYRGEGFKVNLKLYDTQGNELVNGPPSMGYYLSFFGPKAGYNGTYLFSSYVNDMNKLMLNRWTSQVIADNSFSINGTTTVTAFDVVDENTILAANNNTIVRLSSQNKRFITLQVPPYIDVEEKPIVIKAKASDGSPVKISLSGNGILKDSILTWNNIGVGTINAKFVDNDCYVVSQNFNVGINTPLIFKTIPTLTTDSASFPIEFLYPVDTSLVSVEVSGDAYILNNRVYVKGTPGTVCLKGTKRNTYNDFIQTTVKCFDVIKKTNQNIVSGVEEQKNVIADYLPFPNPSTDGFYLFIEDTQSDSVNLFSLFNTNGTQIPIEVSQTNSHFFYVKPIEKQHTGIYLIRFTIKGKSHARRVIFE